MSFSSLFRLLAAFCAFVCGFAAIPVHAAEPEILVFAAASATDALKEIGALYQEQGLGGVKASFASSSTLAKQIEQGAPADVFLSASSEWMDYLAERNLLVKDSRANLLRNRIVLIVPADSPVKEFALAEGADLLSLLGKDGRLAVGDPAHVPVGRYGKEALEKLAIWVSVRDRLAPAKDVRAGLALVEQGEAPLGLVYETDAASSSRVRVIAVFPKGSHTEVVYPVAAMAGKQQGPAGKFLAFLKTPEARAIFKKYGFEAL